MKEHLNICNSKRTQQLKIVNTRESEESDMTNKLHSVCEVGDEYIFKNMQLECEMKKFQQENSELKPRPKESLPDSNDI